MTHDRICNRSRALWMCAQGGGEQNVRRLAYQRP